METNALPIYGIWRESLKLRRTPSLGALLWFQAHRVEAVHVVIAVNSAEAPLASLVARVADKRNSMVGVPGVFVLRPDDVDQLVNNIRT